MVVAIWWHVDAGLLGLIIGLVVWGVKQFTVGGEAGRRSGDTSLEIAQKRLARGEITREEAGTFQHASRL